VPRVKAVTARKEYKCQKCGADIKKGDKYLRGICNFKKDKIVCTKCGLQWWELSNSEYIFRTQSLLFNIENYDTPEAIYEELEDLKSTLEESLENMPENLRENSSSGETLQEYIDNLDSCLYEFDDIDTDSGDENWREEYINIMESNL